MEVTSAAAAASEAAGTPSRSRFGEILRSLRRDVGGMIGLAIFATLVVSAIFAPWIAPHDPQEQNLSVSKKPPAWSARGSWEYPLGTDNLGRDLFSRIVYGSRVSLTVGFFGVLIAAGIGLAAGLIAGYVGGRVNHAIMRVIDVFYAFPSVLLAVAISGALGAGIFNAILALTLVFIPQIIRVAESVTQGVRNLDFVDAARASGAGGFTIVRVHVLGNVLGPIFVYATSLISVSMILASGLSFLGLGVRPPEASWGNLITEAISPVVLNTLPWQWVPAAIAITAMVLGVNFVGDGLRDAIDPKTTKRR